MATGYFFAHSNQGGSVPPKFGLNTGDGLVVADWCLTQGPSPWTKTVVGTNINRYQAPGGSQITVELDDSYAIASAYFMRARGFVGGVQFPSTGQETSGPTYHQLIRKVSYHTSSIYACEWLSIRTDRMWIFLSGGNSASSLHNGISVFGDLPVFDPADPGLCVCMGMVTNVAWPNTTNSAAWATAVTSSNTSIIGAALTNKMNNVGPVPCTVTSALNHQSNSVTLAHHNGVPPLSTYLVGTSANLTTSLNNILTFRGWIPYLRSIPVGGSVTTGISTYWQQTNPWVGDQMSAGGNTYWLFQSQASYNTTAVMVNDGEALP